MKTTNILYWVFTAVLCAATLGGGIYDLTNMNNPEVIEGMHKLQLPAYLLPLLGTAKVLAVIAILWPGFHRLTEWAYAGIAIDVLGAAYCQYFAGIPVKNWLLIIIINLAVLAASYYFHHERLLAFRKKAAEAVAA